MEKNEIMTDENQLSSEEIKKLRNLIDTEEIKKLRLKYSYHMDARELDDLMDVIVDEHNEDLGHIKRLQISILQGNFLQFLIRMKNIKSCWPVRPPVQP